MSTHLEKTTLGGGCFWCLETVFDRIRGVHEVVSGYAGGEIPDPTYEQVCSGTTGHAEVIQITYDPEQIAFREIMEIFFTMHDPTTKDKQGPDVGTQYRSIVLYHDAEQERIARQVAAQFETIWDGPVVTEFEPVSEFFPAEKYHQNYYASHSWQPYCQAVIAPKVAKLRQKYSDRLKEE